MQGPVRGVRGIDPEWAWSCHTCSHALGELFRVSDIKGDDYSTALSVSQPLDLALQVGTVWRIGHSL